MIKLKDLLFEDKIRSVQKTLDDIQRYVQRNSSFTEHTRDDAFIHLSTRENGDHFRGKPGKEDLNTARKLKKDLSKKYPKADIKVDYTDEWTFLQVDLKNEVKNEYRYRPVFASNREGKYGVGYEVFNELDAAISYIEKLYGRGFVPRSIEKDIKKAIKEIEKVDYIESKEVFVGSGKEVRGTGYKDTKYIFIEVSER